MNKKNLCLFYLILGFFGVLEVNAQIGIAVAKDEKGSSLEWNVVWNKGYQTESIAIQNLRDKGYKKVFSLTGGEKRGHKLQSGYWVVVEATHKIYDGTLKTSFGLGASSSSYAEAEERAVSNLSQYDWSWKKSNGYTISKKGTF